MRRTRKSRSPKYPIWDDPKALGGLCIALLLIFSNWAVRSVVLVIAALLVLGYYLWHRRILAQRRLTGIDEIKTMTGVEFEERLWLLFKDLGYEVKPTPRTGDFGADLLLFKAGVKIAVQAKRYSKPVGTEAVQEVVASKSIYGCNLALIVTNASFTKQARELAQVNQVELWDGERLEKELTRVVRNQNSHLSRR
jgi:restriction system protein